MLSNVENRITYSGNGNATEFPYQFKILDRTDIKVLLTDAACNATLLTKDYYVDIEKNVVYYPGYAVGAEVPDSERPAVLPAGWKLTIYREVPVTQDTDLPDQYPFNQVEDIGDKLTMICQQLTDVANRSLKVNVDTSSSVSTTIPWERGKSFRINDSGTGIELTEDPARVLPLAENTYAQTQTQAQIATASAAAAARSENNAAVSASASNNSAQSASASASAAAAKATEASKSATEASKSAHTAAGYVSNVTVWNKETEYNPPDVVMVEDGSTYRCIQSNSNSEPRLYPQYWAMTTSIESKTFEYDRYGNLMPLLIPLTSSIWDITNTGDIMPKAKE